MQKFIKIIFLFVLSLSGVNSFSNNEPNSMLYKEGNNLLSKGLSLNNENILVQELDKNSCINADYIYRAKTIFKQILEKTPNNADANFKMGLCYYFSFDEQLKAIPYFAKAAKSMKDNYVFTADSGSAAPYYVQYFLAETYLQKNETDSALKYFTQYLSHYKSPPISCEHEILMCLNAKKSVKNPRNVKIKALESINSAYAESNPVMKLDNSFFLFSSRRPSTKNTDSVKTINSEDIYYIAKNAEGKWSEVKPFTFNSANDEEPLAISADGTTLYLLVNKNSNADIYTSNYKDGKWTKPVPFKEINSSYHENGFSISNDGSTIYFSSNRLGGLGGFDIYCMKKNTKNKWGSPVNVGPTINTSSNEFYPNLTPDGKSLYFSADGYVDKCDGGFDIYFSEIKSNKFSDPQNMGYPINRTRDDINLFAATEGKRFYSQINEGRSYDIVEVMEGGFDFDAVEASTEVVTVTNEMNVTQTLETEKQVEKEVAVTQTIETEKEVEKEVEIVKTVEPEKEAEKEVEIKSADELAGAGNEGKGDLSDMEERGNAGKVKALTSENTLTIFFGFNQSELSSYNSVEVKKFISTIMKYPNAKIEIIGYCDIKGDWPTNFKFSVNRAKNVYEYLIANNVAKNRMIYYGKGNMSNIADNESEEDRQKNRRTEIIILIPKTNK